MSTIGTATETSKPIGDADGEERRVLADVRLNGIDGGHDILAAAQQVRVVVGEHGRHLIQIEPSNRIEREALKRKTKRRPAGADGLGPFRENRAEALGASLEHAGARIELVGEAGRRRRQRNRDELADDRVVNWPKLHWKSLLKCAECDCSPGSVASLSTTSPLRTEEVREQRRRVLDRNGQIERLLLLRRRVL